MKIDYEEQANDFLMKTGTKFECKFIKTGKHFADDKDERDIYQITLTRGARSYSFSFGNSVNNSGKYIISIYVQNSLKLSRKFAHENEIKNMRYGLIKSDMTLNKNFAPPSSYCVLACLTKYDPDTFENFCSEFGYDTDSKKAEKIYLSVKDEYMNVCMLFNTDELELMQEIQ